MRSRLGAPAAGQAEAQRHGGTTPPGQCPTSPRPPGPPHGARPRPPPGSAAAGPGAGPGNAAAPAGGGGEGGGRQDGGQAVRLEGLRRAGLRASGELAKQTRGTRPPCWAARSCTPPASLWAHLVRLHQDPRPQPAGADASLGRARLQRWGAWRRRVSGGQPRGGPAGLARPVAKAQQVCRAAALLPSAHRLRRQGRQEGPFVIRGIQQAWDWWNWQQGGEGSRKEHGRPAACCAHACCQLHGKSAPQARIQVHLHT